MAKSSVTLHKNDLPAGLVVRPERRRRHRDLGPQPHRDRLCLVQLSSGDGSAHLVQFDGSDYAAPNLKALLADPAVLKIFHFARFDIAVFEKYLGVVTAPVYCTKIASKLVRTYTDRHGLKDLVRRIARHRPVEAAAKLGLGRRRALASSSSPMPPPTSLHLHRPEGASSTPCWRAKARSVRAGGFRLPRHARSSTSPAGAKTIFSRIEVSGGGILAAGHDHPPRTVWTRPASPNITPIDGVFPGIRR